MSPPQHILLQDIPRRRCVLFTPVPSFASRTPAAGRSLTPSPPRHIPPDEGTCYIPCAFVTHYGKGLDDKTALLRSQDAVNREGLKLIQAIGGYDDARQVVSYLGWEQEFFVISKEAFQARPDLRACGRTVMGKAPARGQEMDQHYFGCMPPAVKACMDEVQARLLEIGCPLNVYHNEVAPAQHEISPFFTITNISSDLNQIAMQICVEVAAKHDQVILFHEKPFAGINGSGKHNNWSIGTDTGINFFNPGKDDKQSALFATGVACLAYALNVHNTVIRNSVAHAGNDHRLGAQEAPPAIISLYPGTAFEAKMKDIMAGGALHGYYSTKDLLDTTCANLNPVERGIEDRNRTAPFPFCGNRFEFRAPGSSQSCAFPMAMVNTAMASGMAALSAKIAGGLSVRDAVAQMFTENQRIVFCGNGYSAEWPIEAEKRGLPNLKDAVDAAATFNSDENKALFSAMGVMDPDEVDARAEILFENYATVIETEARCMVEMVRTGVEPACAADLAAYAGAPALAAGAKRLAAYNLVTAKCDELEAAAAAAPHDAEPHAVAAYQRTTVKPLLAVVRAACDAAEGLCKKEIWPFPDYETCVYSHHTRKPPVE